MAPATRTASVQAKPALDPAQLVGAFTRQGQALGNELDQLQFKKDFGATWSEVGELKRGRQRLAERKRVGAPHWLDL